MPQHSAESSAFGSGLFHTFEAVPRYGGTAAVKM